MTDYDRRSGIITLTLDKGQHSPEDIEQRRREVAEMIAASKRERGYTRILHLAHDLPVQTPATAEATQKAQEANLLTDPRDKFAIVISSTLSRMQFGRTAGANQAKAFATEAEARAWLMAD